MANTTLNVKLLQAYDTETNWSTNDPVLLAGQMAISSDKDGMYKVGDGTSTWSALSYNAANTATSATSADTATKLTTARTIRTNLASTSTASFNGTANITPGVTGTLAIGNGGTGTTTGHIAITAGTDTTSTASPDHGGTFTAIDGITKDDYGHVTAVNTKTITLPADNNTDTKVTNTLATTTKAYVTGTTSSSTNTGTQVFDTGVYLGTTAGTLYASTFSGTLDGNATTATTATKLGSSTVGGTAKPIYLSSGTATACSSTVGSSTAPVYMSSGTITACGSSLGVDITGNAATATSADTATSLATARTIDGVSFDGSAAVTNYATCPTTASTTAKVATCSSTFSLVTGARVIVKFTYTNTASAPTLNVNSTGAKSIMKYGTTAPSTYQWYAGAMVEFVYDGTNWIMVNGTTATTTYYGVTKLSSSTSSTSTELAATPSAVKSAYDLATTANSAAATAQSTAETASTAAATAQSTAEEALNTTWADPEIYGDTFVSMGRSDSSTVGTNSFAFGSHCQATTNYSNAMGYYAYATGTYAHAEGNTTTASGASSHSEGYSTTASGTYSHSEGYSTTASGAYGSHAEGRSTTASGNYCHAEGYLSSATVSSAHAEGYYTTATSYASHAGGRLNAAMTDSTSTTTTTGDVFVLGKGTSTSALANAFRVTFAGAVYGLSAFNSSGADYAEFIKPWYDDNPDGEDRVGYFVTVRDGLLYKAEEGDYIAGITSGNPSVVGNSDEDYYGMYERDEFNRIVWEDAPVVTEQLDEDGNVVLDENGVPVMVETGEVITNGRQKISDTWDNTLQDSYVERKDRPEWDYVGMIGVLPVRDDGTCEVGSYCKCGEGGIATLADERGFDTYMVIERKAENVVAVILK